MILQALPDVNMALLDTLSYKIDFSLESSHGKHKLSKAASMSKEEARPVMMMQFLRCQPEQVEAEEHRLDPHAATKHWTS
jgi:hypothetical protein